MSAGANIAARLAERAASLPERTAIAEYRGGTPRETTFGQLAERVAALSAGLRREGVGRGDRVLLFLPMSTGLYVALLGCVHAGATAVFVDAWADRGRLDAAVAAAHPRLFIGTAKAQLLRVMSRAIRRIPRHWTAGPGPWGLERYEVRPPGGLPAAAEVEPGEAALVTFTTGSTGAPKAAARSHAFLWAQHEALREHLELRPEDVDMPTLPVFVLNNLALGIPSVIPDFDPRRPADIRPRRILAQMRRMGVTTTSGSPAFYARLAEACERGGERLDVRLWTGGAPVYPPLARALDRVTGGRAHVVYGSTEAEPIAGVAAGDMLRVMESSGDARGIYCGRPVPGIRLRILRPVDGPVELGAGGWAAWEVAPGETGEIVVSGDHVLGEYYGAPDETRRHKVRDGDRVWHRTGDAGRLDGDGGLWLMGRAASRVERDGRVWWSTEAEVRALAVPGVAHAAYLGVERLRRGQSAVLCVERAEGASGGLAAERLRDALAPIPVDEVHVLSRIPRDPRHASKTDTAALRELLQRERGTTFG